MKTFEVKISHEDCLKLKKLHYLDSSLVALLSRVTANEQMSSNSKEAAREYFNQYFKNYCEYEDFKSECTDKYTPAECNKALTSWNADFTNEVLIFTEEDA